MAEGRHTDRHCMRWGVGVGWSGSALVWVRKVVWEGGVEGGGRAG